MSEIVNTFEKGDLKVKKTDGFLKVTCRKCDRGVEKVTSETPKQRANNKQANLVVIVLSRQNEHF